MPKYTAIILTASHRGDRAKVAKIEFKADEQGEMIELLKKAGFEVVVR